MEVTLRAYQEDHYHRMVDILKRHHCAVDTSPTGSGKSYVAAAVMKRFKFEHVLVVCPKSVKVSWNEVIEATHIPITSIMTYQKLRGQKGIINHPYLVKKGGSYQASEQLTKMITEGCLLVFDEVQNIKNTSDQLKAAKACISLLLSVGGKSRVIFLSGSPFDKEEHSINFMRALGFIKHRNLFTKKGDSGELKLQGAEELIMVCRNHFDRAVTDRIIQTTEFEGKNIPTMCYRIFCEVLKPRLFSAMSPPPLEVEMDVKNGYYKLENSEKLVKAVQMLGKAARYKRETRDVCGKEADWGAITSALMKIEKAKIPIFVRLACQKLEENDKNQVIILVNYTDNLLSIADRLSKFEPMVMNGSSSDKQRSQTIGDFQAGTRRLLVANMKVGGVGINLQDTLGDRPRFMFASPNYMAIDIHQATGRVYREGTLSKPVVRFVYGKVGVEETSILNALSKKNKVMEKILDTQVKDGVIFPGGYQKEEEP